MIPEGPKKPLFHLDKLNNQSLEGSHSRLRISSPKSISPEGSPALVCLLTNMLGLSYLALISTIEMPSLFRCEMSKTGRIMTLAWAKGHIAKGRGGG